MLLKTLESRGNTLTPKFMIRPQPQFLLTQDELPTRTFAAEMKLLGVCFFAPRAAQAPSCVRIFLVTKLSRKYRDHQSLFLTNARSDPVLR